MKLAWMAVGGRRGARRGRRARATRAHRRRVPVGGDARCSTRCRRCSRRARVAAATIRARTRGEPRRPSRAPLAGKAASLLDVEGGWYATLRLPRTRSEEAWALSLLEQDGVYVHPGHFFDFESEAYLVVSLLTPEAVFREGIARLVARVERGG